MDAEICDPVKSAFKPAVSRLSTSNSLSSTVSVSPGPICGISPAPTTRVAWSPKVIIT